MTSAVPRVVYLSSTAKGKEMLHFLLGLPCHVVLAETDDRRLGEFPEYDLGIGFLYTHRIPASEFMEPYRWVNFHPGPLPEFRGRNLAYHAISEDAKEFGATVHYMEKTFDTGELIEAIRFPIQPLHTAGDLVRLSHDALTQLFRKHVPSVLKGRLPSYPQPPGRYFSKEPLNDVVELTSEQARRVRALTVVPKYHAAVVIGGVRYRLITESELNA